MTKWWEKNYTNKISWILENSSRFNITNNELLVILFIQFFNEENVLITPEQLANKTNMTVAEVDSIMSGLLDKQYLEIVIKDSAVLFSLDNLYQYQDNNFDKTNFNDVFKLCEDEFARPLSQTEIQMIADWVKEYSNNQIIDAIRFASVNEKLSMNYINRYLLNSKNYEKK